MHLSDAISVSEYQINFAIPTLLNQSENFLESLLLSNLNLQNNTEIIIVILSGTLCFISLVNQSLEVWILFGIATLVSTNTSHHITSVKITQNSIEG